jgi:hypothetical protein
MKTGLLVLLVPMLSFGMDLMTALSMLETGHNDRMVGRAGEISRYQILKSEWRSVTNSARYADPKVARSVALTLVDRRVRQFQLKHRRDPSDFEFYVLWNAPAQAYRGKVSPVVAERAQRFANLCSVGRPPQPVAVAALAQPPSNLRPLMGAAVARMN